MWRSLIVILAIISGSLCAAADLAAEEGTIKLLDSPVPVVAAIGSRTDTYSIVVFHVGGNGRTKSVHSLIGGAWSDTAKQRLRDKIVWQSPYLFILSNSSGNCWNCSGAAIFRIQGGTVRRLGDLNTYDARNRVPWRDGYFVTTYTKLEMKTGFCAACAPRFLVQLKDGGDRLIVNAIGTWTLNHPRWQENEQKILQSISKGVPRRETEEWMNWNNNVFSAIIENAALAKYCHHGQALRSLLKVVEPILEKQDKERLLGALATVTPGESPEHLNRTSFYGLTQVPDIA